MFCTAVVRWKVDWPLLAIISLALGLPFVSSASSANEPPYSSSARTAANGSEPYLDLRPFRWNSLEEAKLRYANQVIRWARSQPVPKYDRSNPPPTRLTYVERKLLDAITEASSIPDSKADSLAKLQANQRARVLKDAYENAVKGSLKLEPPNKILMDELKRDLKLSIQPTQVGSGTSASREITLRDLRTDLGRRLDSYLEYENAVYAERLDRARENSAVRSAIFAKYEEGRKQREDFNHLMSQRDQLINLVNMVVGHHAKEP